MKNLLYLVIGVFILFVSCNEDNSVNSNTDSSVEFTSVKLYNKADSSFVGEFKFAPKKNAARPEMYHFLGKNYPSLIQNDQILFFYYNIFYPNCGNLLVSYDYLSNKKNDYIYNSDGLLEKIMLNDEVITEFFYENKKLTKIQGTEYDSDGNFNKTYELIFSYGSNGYISSYTKTENYIDVVYETKTECEHNSEGYLVKSTEYYIDAPSNILEEKTYEYNDNGKLQKVISSSYGMIFEDEYQYNSDNKLVKNISRFGNSLFVTNYIYDNNGYLKEIISEDDDSRRIMYTVWE